MTEPTLYHADRSSSSWRVRWGLAIKKVKYRSVLLDLLARDQDKDAFRKLNPMGQVPCLVVDGKPLSESVAILEWLDETIPEPPLYPESPFERARVRQLALLIVAGVQPLQSLATLDFHSKDPQARAVYARHWIDKGLTNYEQLVAETAGKFSFGDTLTMADLMLVPQCANARRFGVELGRFGNVARVERNCLALVECRESAPKAG